MPRRSPTLSILSTLGALAALTACGDDGGALDGPDCDRSRRECVLDTDRSGGPDGGRSDGGDASTADTGDITAPTDAPVETGLRPLPGGAALVRVEDDAMEPLARRGQFVLVAAAERRPREGELVVCWTRRKGVLIKRLVDAGPPLTLFSVNPTAYEPVRLDAADLLGMRVVVGTLFE